MQNSSCGFEEVDAAYVRAHLGKVILLDVRSVGEYTGRQQMGEARPGHIPGAVLLPILSLFNEDGSVRPEREVEAAFEAAGLSDRDAEIIVYCAMGYRAKLAAQVMAERGFSNLKVYTASYFDWAADPANPVEL